MPILSLVGFANAQEAVEGVVLCGVNNCD